MPPQGSEFAFLILIALMASLRLVELAVSARHERALRRRGGREVGREHFPAMALLHLLFLVAAPAEVLLLGRPFRPLLAGAAVLVLVLAQGLRWWAIATLGDRWTVRVLVVPGEAPKIAGPYRFLRHPNYLAVVLEFLALPLVHGAYLSALVFSVANALVLRRRIAVEERALEEAAPYRSALPPGPGLLPRTPRMPRRRGGGA